MTGRMHPSHIAPAWLIAIEAWKIFAYQQNWATDTIATRLQHLHRDARRLPPDPWSITGLQLRDWFERQRWAQETKRGHRSTLRSFYSWGQREGHIDVSPALSLPRVKPAPPNPRPTPEAFYVNALAVATVRERLMLRLGGEYGLRRGEVAQVWPERDLFEDLLGWSLRVHGKGGKIRELPLSNLMTAELQSLGAGWALPGDFNGHLSPRWVGTLVSRLLPDGWTMHSLRHRFADRTYEIERDLAVVQELLGHASIATTRLYIPVRKDRLRATVEAASGVGPVRKAA